MYTTPVSPSSAWTTLSANTGLLSLTVAGLGFDPEGEGTLYAATLGRGIFDYEFVAGGTSPQVSIDTPLPPTFTTTSSPIPIFGTAGGVPAGIFKVFWSTNRGHFGVATLVPPNWNTSAVQVPLEVGPNFITVTAVANDSSQGSAAIEITLEQSEPVIFASPPSLAFGTLPLGSLSAVQIVTVRNDGSADLLIGALSVGGANPSQFVKTAPKDLCSGRTLAPNGGTCTAGVKFQPTNTGLQNATLQIPSNDPVTPVKTVTLSGTGGGATPVIFVSPPSLAFGTLPVGSLSTVQIVTVRNDGAASLLIGTLSVGGTNPSQFVKTAPKDLCSGRTLAPNGGTCTAGVKFQPTATGLQTTPACRSRRTIRSRTPRR